LLLTGSQRRELVRRGQKLGCPCRFCGGKEFGPIETAHGLSVSLADESCAGVELGPGLVSAPVSCANCRRSYVLEVTADSRELLSRGH